MMRNPPEADGAYHRLLLFFIFHQAVFTCPAVVFVIQFCLSGGRHPPECKRAFNYERCHTEAAPRYGAERQLSARKKRERKKEREGDR